MLVNFIVVYTVSVVVNFNDTLFKCCISVHIQYVGIVLMVGRALCPFFCLSISLLIWKHLFISCSTILHALIHVHNVPAEC